MKKTEARCRIGIDVGGTFTDFVLTNPASGEIVRYKEPSVPSDPSLSVGRGLPALIARAGVRPEDVELLVHGTTLLVNAIIQRRGARVGLVVSRGHRGVLEIGRMSLDNSFDFTLRKEEPLVPRNLVLEVGARIRADGSVAERPDPAELDRLASDLAGGRRRGQSPSSSSTPMPFRRRSARLRKPSGAACPAFRSPSRRGSGRSSASSSAGSSRS